MSKYYLNEDHTYRPATLEEWSDQFENMERHVAEDIILGKRVSTVWLGLDHAIYGNDPLVFETMIFSEHSRGDDIYMERYTTWEEALEGHQKAIAWVRKHYG